jgi:hypothetical protein
VVYRGKHYVPPSVREMQEKEEQERKALISLDPEEEEGAAGSSTTQTTAVDLSGDFVLITLKVNCLSFVNS